MTSKKVEQLSKHIDECRSVLEKGSPQLAAEQIIAIEIAYYPDNFGIRAEENEQSHENLKNLKFLIAKMEVRLGELSDEFELQQHTLQAKSAQNKSNENIINISNNGSANATVNQNISLNSVLKSINGLPNEILDKEVKEKLEGLLREIDALKEKDKEKAKSKVKEFIKYAADKCVDAAITCLPYLCEVSKLF